MNYVMHEGKKAVAENIVYGAFDIVGTKRRDMDTLAASHTGNGHRSRAVSGDRSPARLAAGAVAALRRVVVPAPGRARL